LIDEFLATRDEPAVLYLIPTTRSQAKADTTVSRLQKHFANYCCNAEKLSSGVAESLKRRVIIEPELLDLCNILSVQRAAKRLRHKYERLDAIILNAGIGGWIGVDWPVAIKQFFRDGMYFITKPEFKIGAVGDLSPSQLPKAKDSKDVKEANSTADARTEPELGAVFTANLFGHYLLVHYLMPLLSRSATEEASRVIWVGTLEAYASTFSMDDFQGTKTSVAYESSKRLTDLLAMTAAAPSSTPYTTSYFGSSSTGSLTLASSSSALEDTPRKASLRASTRARSSTPNGRLNSRSSSPRRAPTSSALSTPPAMYTTHPGMIVTEIMPLPSILLVYLWIAAFYLARCCGSPWHNTRPYSGATAMTYLALAPKRQLDTFAGGDATSIKWGSATNWRGNERVKRTEVDWLYDDKGVSEGEEKREQFFGLGREAWQQMEEMRVEWEQRLKDAGYDEGL
jgi:3-keto steroid reductase